MSPVTVLCFFSPQPCLQYWPEPGLQHYGPMEVEYVSGAADEDIVSRLFRVQNITRVRHGVGRGAPRVAVCSQAPPVRVTGGACGGGLGGSGEGLGHLKELLCESEDPWRAQGCS